ncbi:hypothetical protein BJF78_09410 [Pseudonocardia sp. CNS-139]|nr:hypothetical protein BJF78_09410 [Pseudonocardia sp. CNS-139]
MRILLLTAGSRGDVEPFAALARRARREGHDVRLAATAGPADLAASGVDAVGLAGDFAAVAAAQGVSPWAALRSYRSVVAPMMAAMLRSAVDVAMAHRPDVIVAHPKVLSARLAAARLGVPYVAVELVPTLSPTREFAAAGVTTADLGAANRLTYRLGAAAEAAFRGPLRRLRADLGLPSRGRLPGPALTAVAVSRSLLPPPPDWPETTRAVGHWHDGTGDGEADPELDAFLARGDVLYAGLGSMTAPGAQERGRAVVGAARASRLRVLVVTGWGGLEVPAGTDSGDDVLVRRAVPHHLVLPRCAAAVHHGAPAPCTPCCAPGSRRLSCRSSPTSPSGPGSCTGAGSPRHRWPTGT